MGYGLKWQSCPAHPLSENENSKKSACCFSLTPFLANIAPSQPTTGSKRSWTIASCFPSLAFMVHIFSHFRQYNYYLFATFFHFRRYNYDLYTSTVFIDGVYKPPAVRHGAVPSRKKRQTEDERRASLVVDPTDKLRLGWLTTGEQSKNR